MKLSKLALIAISASAILAGCASNNQIALQKSDQVSQARVIGSYFGYGKLKDAAVPKDQYVASENFLYNLVDHTSALSVPNVGMGGVHGWDGFGLGLGLSLLQSFVAPTSYEMIPGAFGFVPVQYAKTKEQARQYYYDGMKQSIIDANKRMGNQYKLEFTELRNSSRGNGSGIYQVVYFINSKLGCPAYEEVNDSDKTCRLDLRAFLPFEDTPDLIPTALTNGKAVTAWKISNRDLYDEHKMTMIYWTIAKDSKFDRDEFYKHWMKTLKPYTYVYSEPHKNAQGEKVPPYIIERNKSHFWVVPAKETKVAKK